MKKKINWQEPRTACNPSLETTKHLLWAQIIARIIPSLMVSSPNSGRTKPTGTWTMEANYVFLLGAFLPHLLSLGKDIVHDFGCGVTLTPLSWKSPIALMNIWRTGRLAARITEEVIFWKPSGVKMTEAHLAISSSIIGWPKGLWHSSG